MINWERLLSLVLSSLLFFLLDAAQTNRGLEKHDVYERWRVAREKLHRPVGRRPMETVKRVEFRSPKFDAEGFALLRQ